MKAKKILAGCLLALSMGSLAIGASACDLFSSVKFENWEEQSTATASLGSTYKIQDLSITDTKGKTYMYDISVFNSKGEKVSVIGGEFEILDPNGYTIEYTLQISEKDVRTRETALTVLDEGAPKISVTLPTGFVGDKYTIPNISVSDLSGESITPTYVVYKKADETKTPIAIQNGAFTPEVKGTYVIEITAEDSSGNEAKVTKEFGVRGNAPENILENFDDPSSLLNSINGADQEWLDSYEGREGVVHIKGTPAEKTAYVFRFMREKETYKHLPFDSITISFFVPNRADLYQSTTDGGKISDWFDAQKGVWNEFTITEFVDWDYLFNSATSDRGAQLFWSWTKNTEIYIDEIRFAATPKIDFECSATDGKVTVGSEVNVSASVKSDSRLETYLTVKSPSGENVTLVDGKFTATETGYYTIKAIVESAELSFYDTSAEYKVLSIGNYIKVGDAFEETDIGTVYLLSDSHSVNEKFILPTAVVVDPTGTELNETISVAVTRNGETIEIQDGGFTPTEAGTYDIVYTAGEYTTECKLYVVEGTLQANELENFGLKESAAQIKYGIDGQGVGKTPEWLSEFEGRSGVVKMNDDGSESGYIVRLNKTYEEVKALQWDYIEVDVYLKSGDWLCWGYAIDNNMGAINASTPWVKGQWTTITIARANLANEDSFLRALTGDLGAHIFWGWDIKDDVYIDAIRLRSLDKVLNNFSSPASTAECLNGSNGVGTAATWLESYEGADGVIKTSDGGTMGGFYLRTTQMSATELEAADWEYIEIKLWATNSSWTMFYNQDLVFLIEGGKWTTLNIPRATIEAEMSLSSFCDLLAGSNGAQMFWTWDDLGDVYFDSLCLCGSNSGADSGEDSDADSGAELNDFATSDSTAECLNGSNGVGTAATWLENYEGADGVIKTSDGGTMGGFYLRTTQMSATELEAAEWDYIEIKLWATNSSWTMFYNQDLSFLIEGGKWTTLNIPRSTIEAEMSLSSFCDLLAGSNGAQMFWTWDDLGDVYFDSLRLCSVNSGAALNDFAAADSTAECLNGSNGVGTAATWLESYEGAEGVIKTSDGGAMGGFYLRTTQMNATELASAEWEYLEIKLWATNTSWTMFYNQDLNFCIEGGKWTTLKISRATIEAEMSLSSFCDLLTSSNGAQLFWTWDDLGDVYFDEISIK